MGGERLSLLLRAKWNEERIVTTRRDQNRRNQHPQQRGVAIIGLGCCFPDAQGIQAFWDNICRGHVAIREVPPERWDAAKYFSEDHQQPEKTYSRIGGFLKEVPFDAKRFRIPPKTLESIDDLQKLTLTAAAEALDDAGLQALPGQPTGRAFDRDRCAVILGNAMGGEHEDLTSLRVWFPEARAAIEATDAWKSVPEAVRSVLLSQFETQYKADLPPVTEDSMPGELSNCITGRVANALDLRGANFTTDAACAASMAALKAATLGLLDGEFDLAIAGGADRSMDPPTYVKFAKIGALSGDWSAPFDARANGFVMGEGVGVMVLKRLEDAERDGDRIYAVIRSVGAASDGKGKGMTAPNPRGQEMAVRRAYEEAEISIDTVGLFEAHGTSTRVGDATELRVLTDMLKETGTAKRGVPVGSVKSMIGHLKSAAGSASVIKIALALYHKMLPPSANFKEAPADSPLNEGYLHVNTVTQPWTQGHTPRRAGVSAFGFGGTNFHVVMEEYVKADPTQLAIDPSATTHAGQLSHASSAGIAAAAVAPSETHSISSVASAPTHSAHAGATAATMVLDQATLLAEITALFAEKTGYETSDLDPTFQLESDLGIDTVKQAEIISIVRERYGLPRDDQFKLSATPTLASIAAYVAEKCASKAMVQTTVPATAPSAVATAPVQQTSVAERVPAGLHVLAFGGDTAQDVVANAQQCVAKAQHIGSDVLAHARADVPARQSRLAFLANTLDEAQEKIAEAGRKKPKILAAQGIFLNEGTPLRQTGKIAFMFPGQGSQYVGMFRDLAATYPIVAETFREAEEILEPLIECKLTQMVWPNAETEEEQGMADLLLRQTQYCQPAMLAADVAMLRLLESYGVRPDMVAGHSLGEYAACVAAGVLSFADALYAVSARGREMAGVEVPDNGKMGVVPADSQKVEAVLAEVSKTTGGYVIAANKNCYTQTVIAGGSKAVEDALDHFKAMGMDAREIPVSHAFHSAIVAPAAKPLERVLSALDVRAPVTPILSNVNADYYPNNKADIVTLLGRQLASAVEFIDQINRMYDDGARIFVEVGPRRAVTGFVRNVLGTKEHRAFATNHHKKPGQEGFLEVLAALAADGVRIAWNGDVPAIEPRMQLSAEGAGDAFQSVTQTKPTASTAAATGTRETVVISGLSMLVPDERPVRALNEDPFAPLMHGENFIRSVGDGQRQALLDKNVERLKKDSGVFEPLRDLADVLQLAARMGEVDLVKDYGIDGNFVDALDQVGRMAIATGIDALRDAGLPAVRYYRTTSTGKRLPDRWGLPPELAKTTGVIVGTAFPTFERLVDDVSRQVACKYATKSAAAIESMIESFAGVLRDPAQIAALRALASEHAASLRDEAGLYTFNRKFLFRVMSMSHAQLAQVIVAQGPCTQVNAACASGTQAIGIAQDWIRVGRCDRVLVVSADDATHEKSLSWIGAGFLAAGAATTESDVTRAAIPFGAERNGMILGCGASAFVVEKDSCVRARGMEAVAELLDCTFVNAAYHGTRLDGQFIKGVLSGVAQRVAGQLQCSTEELARRAFFMSHETYTPARGGSSAAEVEAIRFAFGAAATELLIANTKGYTGHPMGATFEDVVAIKGLQRQILPGIANFGNVDPDFADLNFARGGKVNVDVALRFAAGFGSQVAIVAYGRRATSEARLIDGDAYLAWLGQHAERVDARLEIVSRALRVAEDGGVAPWELGVPSLQKVTGVSVHAQPVPSVQPAQPSQSVDAVQPVQSLAHGQSIGSAHSAMDAATVLADVTALFVAQTGYEAADLDPAFQLESDLGIDTVKQAEIMSVIRERYGLPKDDQFKLSDVQTIHAICAYVLAHVGQQPTPPQPPTPGARAASAEVTVVTSPVAIATAPAPKASSGAPSLDRASVLAAITQLFAEQTGYDTGDLDPGFGLESDLGIDTVKQAEIFSVLRERYRIPKDDAFKLSDVQSLNAIADYVVATASTPTDLHGSASATNAGQIAAQSPSTASSAAALDRDAVLKTITTLFAEQTGYDVGDLDPSFQLEADLGIDTVKQAEIFSVLRTRYGLPKDDAFKLSDVQTLNAIVDYVIATAGAGATGTVTVTPAAVRPEPADGTVPVSAVPVSAAVGANTGSTFDTLGFRAQKVTAIMAPARPTQQRSLSGRTVVLAGSDADGMLSALRTQLNGMHATVLDASSWTSSTASAPRADDVVYVVQSPTQLDAAMMDAQVRDVFMLAQRMGQGRGAQLAGAGILIVGRGTTVLGADPALASANTPTDWTGVVLGGMAGVTKTLAKEWPGSRCVACEVDATWPVERAAREALQEWCADGSSATTPALAEVALLGDQRWTLRRGNDLAMGASALPAGSVVVVTGGARGVTYHIVRALASRSALKIAILARTAGLAPQDSPIFGCDEAVQKERAKSALQARGERVTPAAVQRWINQEQARMEVWQNLEALKQLGADVVLYPCDVGDAASLARVAEQVRTRFGAVDVLLHGAGAEESKQLVDKDSGAFDRVFVPKATAALQMLQLFAPRRLVTMGSISGRFGNIGQVDYAAANDLLGALARGHGVQALNLAWTAWGDVGMATRGSVRQVLESYGVALMPVTIGAQWGAELIASGATGDVVIAGALGELAHAETLLPMPTSSSTSATASDVKRVLPWIFDRIETNPQTNAPVYVRRLDPKKDQGLDHHRIEGVSVLPGVMGVELMTRAAEHAVGKTANRLLDVRFASPLKVFNDTPIDARVEVAAASAVEQGVQVTLSSTFVNPKGKEITRDHFSARVMFGDKHAADASRARSVEMPRDPAITAPAIYQRYFHGPSFHVLERVLLLGEDGVDARPEAHKQAWVTEQDHAGFTTQPYLREAGFQAAGIWEMAELGRMALPSRIDEVVLGNEPPAEAKLVIQARRRRSEATGSVFDVWVRGEDGVIYDVMRGYCTATWRDLSPTDRFEPVRTQTTVPSWLALDIDEVSAELKEDPAGTLERYLSAQEQARFAELKTDKRRVDWLAGRIVAKRLIRAVRFGDEGAIVPYHAIAISPDALGAPQVKVVGERGPGPRISISHTAGVAAAMISSHDKVMPGIDIEQIEPRDPSFIATYFTADERKAIEQCDDPDETSTAMWALKEAMLKALGIGARVDLREISITAPKQGGGWRIALSGEALARSQRLGAGEPEICVDVDRALGRVVARIRLSVTTTFETALGQATKVEANA